MHVYTRRKRQSGRPNCIRAVNDGERNLKLVFEWEYTTNQIARKPVRPLY